MKNIVKQVVGIDVDKKELVVCLGRMYDDWTPELYAHKVFKNDKKGFERLMAWVKKLTDASVEIRYVMEATGVYHESLAYYLADQGQVLSVVLPTKTSNYFRTLEVRTITDKTASRGIARFGLERKLDNWQRPSPIYKQLRQLTRERDQIVQARTMVKNQLHAEKSEAEPNQSSLKRMKQHVRMLDKQDAEVKKEISAVVKQDKEAKAAMDLISTIPGVGELTAVIILAETNGFELIRSKKQLTGYAGLDVREKQSGTSVKGKPRISKRGNKYLRKALHMPSLQAARRNEAHKDLYVRLVSRHGIKMKGAVAVQRKILELSYTLVKNNQAFDPDYQAEEMALEQERILEKQVVGQH